MLLFEDSGREFQMVGPETQNALSRNLVLVLGTMKSAVLAEHSLLRDRSRLTGSLTSLMYAEDLLLCAMCINSANLNWDNILSFGNQCSSTNAELT